MGLDYLKYENLDEQQKELLDSAETAMNESYSPYSNFLVGAALLSKDNQIISAANVENAAYGNTMCAERSAIFYANAKGVREFQKIAIIGKGQDFDSEDIIAPCGSCRQSLYESAQLSDTNLEVIMSNTAKDKIIISTINELLPLAFGPKDLGINTNNYTK